MSAPSSILATRERAAGFHLPGGRTGILLVHGFTGTPFVFRELAEILSNQGLTVHAPLLAGHGTTADDLHGTTWRDWYASALAGYDRLAATCDTVFILGNSFGGNLACQIAHERKVAGLILVGTPRWIHRHSLYAALAPLLRLAGIRHHVKGAARKRKDMAPLGGPNLSYPKIPLRSLQQLFYYLDRVCDPLLPRIECPALVIQSRQDGLVKPESGPYLYGRLASTAKKLVWISDPHHALYAGRDRQRVVKEITAFLDRGSLSSASGLPYTGLSKVLA